MCILFITSYVDVTLEYLIVGFYNYEKDANINEYFWCSGPLGYNWTAIIDCCVNSHTYRRCDMIKYYKYDCDKKNLSICT